VKKNAYLNLSRPFQILKQAMLIIQMDNSDMVQKVLVTFMGRISKRMTW
jgi:hypothetical protein